MGYILPYSNYQVYIFINNYLTFIGYLFIYESLANFYADSASEKPFKGSSLPKWAITLAVILSSLKIFKSGIP